MYVFVSSLVSHGIHFVIYIRDLFMVSCCIIFLYLTQTFMDMDLQNEKTNAQDTKKQIKKEKFKSKTKDIMTRLEV